jgi:hypothetical protein
MKKIARLRKLGREEQGIFYCNSQNRTEEVAKALGCLYYYLITEKKDKAIKKWLKDRGFITAIKTLETKGDYP